MADNKPLSPAQRAADAARAKKKSEDVAQAEAEEKAINPGGLGALASKEAARRREEEEKKKKVAVAAQKKAINNQ